jgi:hypothetical protein
MCWGFWKTKYKIAPEGSNNFVITIDNNRIHTLEGSEMLDECSICLEYFNIIDTIVIMPCYHTYHLKCYDTYVKRKDKCAFCQMDVNNFKGFENTHYVNYVQYKNRFFKIKGQYSELKIMLDRRNKN